jgi:hypothetical protein
MKLCVVGSRTGSVAAGAASSLVKVATAWIDDMAISCLTTDRYIAVLAGPS